MNAVTLGEFRQVPTGAYMMGSERGMPNERPMHEVTISAFELAILPISNKQFTIFLEKTQTPRAETIPATGFDDPDQPAVAVSWFQAQGFVDWINAADVAHIYRLPTEAEREWAARGGLRDPVDYPWGTGPPDWKDLYDRTLHDGSRPPSRMPFGEPNGYGLYHMGDLVHEWCSDWYDRNYYLHSPRDNPRGAVERTGRRASRGGSWRHAVQYTRVQGRSSLSPDRQLTDYGFRLARDQSV